MKKHIWTITNTLQLIIIIFLDVKHVSAGKHLIEILVHIVVTLFLYPLLLAAILNAVIAIFPLEKKQYWNRFKGYYKYALFIVLFFFLTGNLSLLATGMRY